jgi:hypothetical protein
VYLHVRAHNTRRPWALDRAGLARFGARAAAGRLSRDGDGAGRGGSTVAGAPDAEAITPRPPALGNRRIASQGIDTASVRQPVTRSTLQKEHVAQARQTHAVSWCCYCCQGMRRWQSIYDAGEEPLGRRLHYEDRRGVSSTGVAACSQGTWHARNLRHLFCGTGIRFMQLDGCSTRSPQLQINHLDEHRKRHREIDVALRNMAIQALSDQGHSNEQQKA